VRRTVILLTALAVLTACSTESEYPYGQQGEQPGTEQPTPEPITFDKARTEEVIREALSDKFTVVLNDSRRQGIMDSVVRRTIELMEEHRIRGAVSASAVEKFFLELDIVCEDGRNIRVEMCSGSGMVHAVKDSDTGEWLQPFDFLGVGMPDD